MDIKKLLLASVGGFVVMFLLSWLWHELLMVGFYETNGADVMREQPDMVPITLGYVVLAVLMALVYPMGYKGGAPLQEGMRFGAIVGLLWVLPLMLILSGVWNWPLTGALVDGGWHVVEQAVGGIVIGMIYGGAKAAAPAAPAM